MATDNKTTGKTPKTNISSQGASASPKPTTAEKVREHASSFVSQAADAARNAANEGKTRASETLETFAKVVENAATMVEDKVGPTYGGYARRAADGVSSFAEDLQNKDVDELVEDARVFVRNNPLVAIGAAAAIGFALTRVAKMGVEGQSADQFVDNDA